MTPGAISRRSGLPLEIVLAGLAILTAPDPCSRSKEADGRRLVPIDADRDWGWRIVNLAHYRAMKDPDQLREASRDRVARWREQQRSGDVTPGNASLRPVTAGTPKQKQKQTQEEHPSPQQPLGLAPEPADGLSLVIRNGKEWRPTNADVVRWQAIAPGLALRPQFARMGLWLEGRPSRRPTARGARRFVLDWLKRELSDGRTRGTRRASDDEYVRVNMGG
jgi:hypothetical protein